MSATWLPFPITIHHWNKPIFHKKFQNLIQTVVGSVVTVIEPYYNIFICLIAHSILISLIFSMDGNIGIFPCVYLVGNSSFSNLLKYSIFYLSSSVISLS